MKAEKSKIPGFWDQAVAKFGNRTRQKMKHISRSTNAEPKMHFSRNSTFATQSSSSEEDNEDEDSDTPLIAV